MKKETLKEKIWDITMLYETATEEGDKEEHESVVSEILELFEEERQSLIQELLEKIPKRLSGSKGIRSKVCGNDLGSQNGYNYALQEITNLIKEITPHIG